MHKLKVQKLYPDAKLPERAHPQDVGLDLFSNGHYRLVRGRTATIGTGISVNIPDSFAGYVQSRSGLASKYGIFVMNSPGLIDPGYTGELKVILHSTLYGGNGPFFIEPGTKIAQLVIVPAPQFDPVVVESLEESERGESGFGSTDFEDNVDYIYRTFRQARG